MYDIILLECAPFGLDCFWWWLFSFIAFLLGALLYWLLFCRSKDQQIQKLTQERDKYHNERNKIESDFNSVKYQLEEAQKELADAKLALRRCDADKVVLQTKLNRLKAEAEEGSETPEDAPEDGNDTDDSPTSNAPDNSGATDTGAGTGTGTALGIAALGGLNFSDMFGEDNLQIVEGIGPKIESLLKNNGITTWKQLANANPATLTGILEAAGPNYRLANPETWSQQAKLASEGQWEELVNFQKNLSRNGENTGDNSSKVQKLAMSQLGYNTDPNDLKIVEGIGPKIEQLLKNAGINTWAELANAPVDRLKEILSEAGDRYRLADPTTWSQQAALARDSKWGELKEYQDFLSGGRAK